jgi:hypothetical protein
VPELKMVLYIIRQAEKNKLDELRMLVENLTAAEITPVAITNARAILELSEDIQYDGICTELLNQLGRLSFNIVSQNTGNAAASNANIPREVLLEQNNLNQEVTSLSNRLVNSMQLQTLARMNVQIQEQLQQQPQQQVLESLRAVLQPLLQALPTEGGGTVAAGTGAASRSRVPYLSDKIEFPGWDQEKDPDPINWFQIIDNNWTPLQEAEWSRQGHNDPIPPLIKANLAIKGSPELVRRWWTTLDPASEERQTLASNWNEFKRVYLEKFRPADADHRARQLYDSVEYAGHPEQLKINMLQASQRIGGNRAHLKVTKNQMVNDYISKLRVAADKDPSSRCSEMIIKIYEQDDLKRKTNPGYQLTLEDACSWAMNVYRVSFRAGLAQSSTLFAAVDVVHDDVPSIPPLPAASLPPMPPQAHSLFYVSANALNAMPVTRGGREDSELVEELQVMWGDDPDYAEDVLCRMLVENNARSRNFTQDEKSRRLCYNCGSPHHLIAKCPKSPNQQGRKPFKKRMIAGKKQFPAFRTRFADRISNKTRFFRRRGQTFTRLEVNNPEDLDDALSSLQDDDTIWVGNEEWDGSVNPLCWIGDDQLMRGQE